MRLKYTWERSGISTWPGHDVCDIFALQFSAQLLIQNPSNVFKSRGSVSSAAVPNVLIALFKIDMPSMSVSHYSLIQYPHLGYFHLLYIAEIAEHYVFNLPKCISIVTIVAGYRFTPFWIHQHKLSSGYKCTVSSKWWDACKHCGSLLAIIRSIFIKFI